MTSNLGAAEMSSIPNPGLSFMALKTERNGLDEKMDAKLTRAGAEAVRRKVTPEFMIRIDRLMVFKPLGTTELRKILELETRLPCNGCCYRRRRSKPVRRLAATGAEIA